MNNARNVLVLTLAVLPAAIHAQPPVEVVRVTVKAVERQVKLSGEFRPYLAVPIHAKVSGFVRQVLVDRGSAVRRGQLLAALEAPEMEAQIVEAQARMQAVELQRTEAEARLSSAQSTYERLKAAAATPGVIAENDLVVAQKGVEAAQASVRSQEGLVKAAQAHVQAVRNLEQYLQIRAPFDGIVSERNVHPGAPRRARFRFNTHAPSASGVTVATGCPSSRSGGRRNRQRRTCAIYGARIPRRNVLRRHQSDRVRSRRENTKHAGRTGRAESRSPSRPGHVPRGLVAGAAARPLDTGPTNEHRHDDRTDVCDPHTA
jgi:hypothetical protein